MTFKQLILNQMSSVGSAGFPARIEKCSEFSRILIDCYKNEGTVFSCGNGGSHCDAMHFAEELSGKFREERKPLPAISISDPSHITCVGNDYGFDHIFSKFMEGVGKKGDTALFFGFTNCPDVCPMTLNKLTYILNELEKEKKKLKNIFY